MAGDNDDKPIAPPSREELDDMARLLEAERGNWWQSVDVLGKAMVIYLAILAALIGYVLSATLDPLIRRSLLVSAILVTLAYGTVNGFALLALVAQRDLVHKLSLALARPARAEKDASHLYALQHRLTKMGAAAAFAVGALFVGLLVLLLFRG